ncbi:hypothetical protein GCM10011390_11260 [Aureimonas endophytica]|uniref:Uncharacterized protein n=1 Tax=Aureimonas endophytica TaxID=2027858 RepID=A0A917E1W7_9HYPH|nr:hypothetical protein [Aureimonas endophytica]GGD94266.1 hypothetical protein GCM10011390_11260 [Aureimonas endophytica]
MADLGAVLRKTIDGLPNATPELRAKVYEKARAAILRQIENANPPLADDVVAVRTAALEDAIEATEAHYLAVDGVDAVPEPLGSPLPVPPPAAAAEPPRAPRETEGRPPFRSLATPATPADPIPRMPRADAEFARAPAPSPSAERRVEPDRGARPERREPRLGLPDSGIRSIEPEEGGLDIPGADTSAPRYAPSRPPRPKKSRAPLFAGVAALALIALGAGGYLYRGEIETLIGGETGSAANTATPAATPSASSPDVASLPSTAAPDATPGATDGGTGAAPSAAPAGASKRRFTQRLLPDGREVDEGPGAGNPNAFDEGTNVAAATPEPVVPPGAAPSPAAPPAAQTPAPPATGAKPNAASPAVSQRAMFYEERTDTQQGTQQLGNVVWSVVNEPPADDQPPEPAIRAVADVPSEKLKMTMTIRRNLDATLPASHVIELQFDVPPGFDGGQIVNVQRLALKPTEEARGEPLIGVAGKISDGFFVVALNNLDKATETNLALLGKQEWIDVPIAYATGRRALISIEKGVPGDRVFKQAMEAWAAKT